MMIPIDTNAIWEWYLFDRHWEWYLFCMHTLWFTGILRFSHFDYFFWTICNNRLSYILCADFEICSVIKFFTLIHQAIEICVVGFIQRLQNVIVRSVFGCHKSLSSIISFCPYHCQWTTNKFTNLSVYTHLLEKSIQKKMLTNTHGIYPKRREVFVVLNIVCSAKY